MRHSQLSFLLVLLTLPVTGLSQRLAKEKYSTSPYAGEVITGASIKFDTTRICRDFVQGEEGLFVFSFVNDGNEPLIITCVKSSCGCLVPHGPKDPIKPGQRAEILGKYNTGRLGVFSKTMTVESNASEPYVVLVVCGQVFPSTIEPSDSLQQFTTPYNRP